MFGTQSCPAASFALVILWLGAAAVIIAAGGSRGAVAGAWVSFGRHLTGTLVRDCVEERAGAGA